MNFKKILSIMPLFLLTLAGCKEDTISYTENDIKISQSDLTLNIDQTFDLNVSNFDLNGSITWSTSDASIATVDSKGVVKGISQGKTTISASYKDLKSSIIVTVTNSVLAPYIELNYEEDINIYKNQSLDINAKVIFDSEEINNVVLNWTTTNSNVVSLVNNGYKASIYGKEIGESTILVYGTYMGYELTSSVNVNVVENKVQILINNLQYEEETSSLEMNIGSRFTLDCVVIENGELKENPNLVVTVDDPSIVSVDGLTLNALTYGSTNIYLNYANKCVKELVVTVL